MKPGRPQFSAKSGRAVPALIPVRAKSGRAVPALSQLFLAATIYLTPLFTHQLQAELRNNPAAAAAPAGPMGGAAGTPPEIRDILPPVDVFPYPPWMIACAAAAAVLVLTLLLLLLMRWLKNRPGAPALSARQLALKELQALEPQIPKVDCYAFSISITEILRRFVHRHFGIPATRQTSPEFFAALAGSERFSEDDRKLLASFLEKCDAIKFARIDANIEDSAVLFRNAHDFIGGPRA